MKEFLGYLFGLQPMGFVAAYFVLCLVGQLLVLLVHYKVKGVPKGKFDKSHWRKDNQVRIATSLLMAYAILACFPYMEGLIGFVFVKIGIPYTMNVFVGFLVGVFMDLIIIMFRNKTKVNIFQAKS